MQNKAFILGCSHAAGSEMADGKNKSYPCLIAEQLGYSHINLAVPGGSNDAVFRILIDNINNITINDIVIACWTGLNRTEVYDYETKVWQTINLTSNTNSYHKHWLVNHGEEKFGQLNKIKNILALNTLCQRKTIKVINVDSFWPIWDIQIQDLFAIEDNFWDWSLSNNFSKTNNGHFDLDAHRAFANHILRNINELH